MSNTFAYFMLCAWPVLSLLLFRKYTLPLGLSLTVVVGYLVLPPQTVIELPLLPMFDKALSITIAGILLSVSVMGKRLPAGEAPPLVLPGWIPKQRWMQLALVGLFLGSILTALTNSEPLFWGPKQLHGLTPYDGLAAALAAVARVIPALLGRKFLASPESQKILLVVLLAAMAIYTVPVVFELRMSPQLNNWLYGDYSRSYRQLLRGGGYRPVVFTEHPLWLAILLGMGFFSTVICARVLDAKWRVPCLVLAGWFLVVLVFTKCFGALAIAILFGPVALLAPMRVQILVAALVAGTVIIYPTLRKMDLVPVDRIVGTVASIDAGRAQSLATRLKHEDILLEHGQKKPVFGWGPWNRWRVHNEQGKDTTISDGAWTIILTQGGWVRYLSVFSLLAVPIILLAVRRKQVDLDPVAAGLAMVLMVNMIDLIPNATLTPVTFLLAGALAGRLEYQRVRVPDAAVAPKPQRRSLYEPVLPGYARSAGKPAAKSATGAAPPAETPAYTLPGTVSSRAT